ncbi:hypothetical protein BDY19DRAFT_961818 [Irpex rosettiformis]|uniref:Uncharacterized protein n=1 Tax=Irpex rosettiformis TaxID=378272 RepID=A0ACB8TVX6_9APHY|nr:hypothetical protein BDY19DRAFT_961818 [Irpex rosettiformis]
MLFHSVVATHAMLLRLESNPKISGLVRELYFSTHPELRLPDIDDFIKILPSLHSLDISANTFPRDDDEDQLFSGEYHIENLKLQYEFESDFPQDTDLFIQDITQLLSLFSRIGVLDIELFGIPPSSSPDSAALVHSAVERHVVGALEIYTLLLRGGLAMDTSFFPQYLIQIGAVHRLTSIKCYFIQSHELDGFCGLLIEVQHTLKILSIYDYPDYDWTTKENTLGDVGSYLKNLSRGLSVCSLLEEMEVEMAFENSPEDKLDELRGCRECFDMAINMVALVPKYNLRRVRISFYGYTLPTIHHLEWSHLHDLCRKFPDLQWVDVALYQPFDQRKCLAYEMSPFEAIFTPRYIKGLVKDPPERLECKHNGCKKHNEAGSS